MFTVRANDSSYSVTFRQTEQQRLDKRGFEPVVVTSATIWLNDPTKGPVPMASGYAHKSAKDLDNTALGSELAFARALKKFTPSKFTREQFWDAYRAATRPRTPTVQQEVEQLTKLLKEAATANGNYCGTPGNCVLCDQRRRRLAELRKEATWKN